MIKKSFCYIVVTTFLFLLISCGMTPDKMIEDFNKGVYKDNGNGDYTTENGDPSVSTTLIPDDRAYTAYQDGVIIIDVSRDYLTYEWTLIDNDSNKTENLPGRDSVVIYPSVRKLKVNGNYSVKLVVMNMDGAYFTDSTRIHIIPRN